MGVNLSEHKFTDPLLKFGFRTVSQEAQESLKDYLLLLNFQAKRIKIMVRVLSNLVSLERITKKIVEGLHRNLL